VDTAAFVHKLVLSVDAELSETHENVLQQIKREGIFHPGGLYSRRVSGKFWLSGNRVVVLHGRTRNFPNVPTLWITMHSGRIPLTAAEAILLTRRVTLGSPEIRVSSIEFTFDVTGTTIDYLLRHLIYRAKKDARVLSDGERRTIYVGSPRSAWQVRIYDKRRPVLRIEFVLRRASLSRWGISRPEDLLLLRRLNVWELLSIRRFSASSAARVTRDWDDAAAKELVLTWGEYRRPLRLLPRILKNHGVHPHQVLRRTCLQRKLEAMQRRFIW
jgi:hypothetical protein